MSGYVRLADETLDTLERAGVEPSRIAAMRETRDELDGRAFVGRDCTLDGGSAIVCGRRLPFGIVACTAPGSPLRAEYAWPTIARVMAAGGAFRT